MLRGIMQKTDNMPLWVYLAFSSIATRKGALLLIGFSVVFTIYCMPWTKIITNNYAVMKIFLIEDWSWFVMMVPVNIWYWMSLRWIDNNSKWKSRKHVSDI
jgi:hypothetical protein